MGRTAKDYYLDQLEELLSADRASRDATARMAELTDGELKTALDNGVCGIREGIGIVEDVLSDHHRPLDGRRNAGMDGLVADTERDVISGRFETDDARDDAIVMQFQRFTHFGLASYAALVSQARRMGLGKDAGRLQTCLDNARDGRDEMQKLLDKRAG